MDWLEKENDEKPGVSFHTLVFSRRVIQLLAIVILIGIFWWIVSPMFVTQQRVYSSLDEIFTELKSLRSSSVNEESWSRFRERSLTRLYSFVPKLEKEADVSDPASLSLLAVTSDYLPKLLIEKSRYSDELEYKITWHLDVARSAISRNAATVVPPEFWMLLLVSLNVGIVLWFVMFAAKKLLVKAAR
jgi:hypothetical protein